MREVELKGALSDPDAAVAAVRKAGATLVYAGRLEDERYDFADRSLAALDHVLRLRVYREQPPAVSRAVLEFKGPTTYADGYKVREEHSAQIGDADELAMILDRLGYQVTREIDREIEQYTLAGATVRFERYPRMDVLVEVEGEPAAIEKAIAVLGQSRATFTTGRLLDFVRAYEQRTGERAAICDREIDGDYRYSAFDA